MEASEHVWIGDQVTLTFDDGKVASPELPLAAGPGNLTYGQLVALGGDFYGDPGRPISTDGKAEEAFIAAYDSLAKYWTEVRPILALIDKEEAAVQQAIKSGEPPSRAYRELGDTLSMEWNRVTQGGYQIPPWLPPGRYLQLAATNWDHFAQHAVAAYRAGHTVALARAAKAGAAQGAERTRLLQYAYATNAFADHFLTDLFSAGHLRVPRKELADAFQEPAPGLIRALGGLLSRGMHNEDGDLGLRVTNARGDTWTAYGDKMLRDEKSAKNRELAVAATQASADDVWAAFRGESPSYSALEYVADLEKVQVRSDQANGSPLFTMIDGRIMRRADLNNQKNYEWTYDWWGWSTYLYLDEHRPWHKPAIYDLATGKKLGWLGVSYQNYVKLVDREEDAPGLMWVGDTELRLRKDGSPQRFLGLAEGSYADWGLSAGWSDAVLYNSDQTISLKSDPRRLLALGLADNFLMWANGEMDNVVRIDLPWD